MSPAVCVPARVGHVLGATVASLGLPTRLRNVGVNPEQLDRITELSMHDRWIHTNPRKIDGPPVVRELLDAAWWERSRPGVSADLASA